MLGGGEMNDISVSIQPEAPDDAEPIERLHERTFGPGRYAKTAYRLREQVAHRLDLSFTARIGTLLGGSGRLSSGGRGGGQVLPPAPPRPGVPGARRRPGADPPRAQGGRAEGRGTGDPGRRRAVLRPRRLSPH